MKTFGRQRPRRDESGAVLEYRASPAGALTVGACGFGFGADSKRRLIVSLEAGDLVCLRPARTNRTYRIAARDLFRHLLTGEANVASLAKARAVKTAKAEQLARARRQRAERRLFNHD